MKSVCDGECVCVCVCVRVCGGENEVRISLGQVMGARTEGILTIYLPALNFLSRGLLPVLDFIKKCALKSFSCPAFRVKIGIDPLDRVLASDPKLRWP